MSILRFFEGIKFNFVNFLAFSIFLACFSIWFYILINDMHENVHAAEIRNSCGNIMLLVIGFYFGASQGSKRKDEQIQQMIHTSAQKDETISQLATNNNDSK